MLRVGGLVVNADWPDPRTNVEAYARERTLVSTVRADVRDIVETAGIDDPRRVDLVVAPEWKYTAYEMARTADPETNVADLLLEDPDIAAQSGAGEYAADLQSRQQALEPRLSRETERAILERSAWLLDDEFGVTVDVSDAEAADSDLAERATPGRPAIHIS